MEVREVKLMKDGLMVTPKTLIPSIHNLDGSKLSEKLDKIFKNILPLNWDIFELDFNCQTIMSAKFVHDKFIVTDSNSLYAYSKDGYNWTCLENVAGTHKDEAFNIIYNTAFNDVTYGNGKFVGVGFGLTAWSDDGITWTRSSWYVDKNSLVGNSHINSVTYGNEKFVAVGDSGKIIVSSDGATWTSSSSPFGTTRINSVTYAQDKFVAVGNSGKIAYSSDGSSWTLVTVGSNNFKSLAYGNDKFIAVGSNGAIVYSANGVNWTSVTSITSNDFNDVVYGNCKFIACANGDAALTYSMDGKKWHILNSNQFGYVNHIAYAKGKYLIDLQTGTIGVSEVSL